MLRIIDKNNDFYDYLQNVYRDNSIVFDRTDSYVLTKELICERLFGCELNSQHFVLLQVCNTFWLFLLEITEESPLWNRPVNYKVELIATWKNYNKERVLIKFEILKTFRWNILKFISNNSWRDFQYDRKKIAERVDVLIQAIDTGDYRIACSFDKHTVTYGNGEKVEKHTPLLKASGFSSCIDPLDIFLAFEEYFSAEKSAIEKTESKGITDKERIENHGFDTKTSFRGRR